MCLKNYDFDRDPSLPGTAHFTQIVWKSTKLLGIGRAIMRRGRTTCTYFVARYQPAGNWVGRFRDEVRKGNFTNEVCTNLTKIIQNGMGEPGEGSGACTSYQSKTQPVIDDADDNDNKAKPSLKPSQTQKPKKPTTASSNAPSKGPDNVKSEECSMGSIEGKTPHNKFN